jgi:phosphoribosyl 1,2-cyclic phosphodiesterase
LGSGSKGNAVWVEENGCAILIDDGLSVSQLTSRARMRGLEPENLYAVFVTHEHGDHIGGVGDAARHFSLKVYTSPLTMEASRHMTGWDIKFQPMLSGDKVKVGPLSVSSFSCSHDAADPMVYVIRGSGSSLGVATDLGVVTHLVRSNFLSLSAAVREFNHDLRMLAEGPYPLFLKQRVKSRKGHLSNLDGARFLLELNHPGLKRAVLGHLSEINNTPEIALAAARKVLEGSPHVPELFAANQWEPTPVFDI